MGSRSRPVDGRHVVGDAGAMHKYAAPRVHVERAREVHRMGLDLQSVAADLSAQQALEVRRAQRVHRMWRAAWLLVVVAVVLLAIPVVPLHR